MAQAERPAVMPENRHYESPEYRCPTCVGTGEIESSDSGDESWWDCRHCNGTGKLADRRRPDRHALTDDELERVLWWLHHPVPPGPEKDLDVRIIFKLEAARRAR